MGEKFVVVCVVLLIVVFCIGLGVSLMPPKEIITNGTISGITINENYYTYDVTVNNIVIHDVISTNFYELHSEHTVYYQQNIIGVTSFGKFV